jgi:hypothetical protein
MGDGNRLTAAWLGLSLITLVSWWIGANHGKGHFEPNVVVTSAVLLIAAVKTRVIMREFMEVRHAPALLRRLTDAWIVLVFGLLLVLYWFGVGVGS